MPPDEVQELFGGGTSGAAEIRQLVLLSRHGHPLLYLPRKRRHCLEALNLYSAQRPFARMARGFVRVVTTAGLLPLLPETSITVQNDSPFAEFLKTLMPQQDLPAFAILAGNPQAPGRRFILLLFNTHGKPAVVVKAGLGDRAIALIEREAGVLGSIPEQAAGVPRLRSTHRTRGVHALAMDYLEGDAPRTVDSERMAQLLGSWIDQTRQLKPDAVPAWQRLVAACPQHALLKAVRQRVETASLHPVLYHGDLAPWNVKVARNGRWQVLDWERGEPIGLPCWDWFHYHIQIGLLVDRFTAERHAQHIDRWLVEEPLQRYASRACVVPLIRELLLAYLLYSMEIIGPRASLPAKRDLLNILSAKWTNV